MQNIHLAATSMTPAIEFDFARHHLSLRGESYPENAQAFYQPLIASLSDYCQTLRNATVTVEVALAYFNSASTKSLFTLFSVLNQAAARGNHIVLDWLHDPEDDTILEFGQELADDFVALEVRCLERI
ncbi:DUF1987 domain-containing protein [Paludibacterium paludis]|uniref:SiaC family regulatory phosphoprotein domain-containing protein n=1 Tax=Paludibacterium paludis TaxID=1225769 RepID=A0A918NX01_9NEIS|nr:DUF1987 domain-containing protein [Paludibacterium paludis]GGY03452.1 hypothetical protein GCM10011289_02190 [Paludibacterium paludis]